MLVLRQDSTQIWRDNKLITEILDSGEIIEYDRKVDNKILSITISKKVKVKINDEKKINSYPFCEMQMGAEQRLTKICPNLEPSRRIYFKTNNWVSIVDAHPILPEAPYFLIVLNSKKI